MATKYAGVKFLSENEHIAYLAACMTIDALFNLLKQNGDVGAAKALSQNLTEGMWREALQDAQTDKDDWRNQLVYNMLWCVGHPTSDASNTLPSEGVSSLTEYIAEADVRLA